MTYRSGAALAILVAGAFHLLAIPSFEANAANNFSRYYVVNERAMAEARKDQQRKKLKPVAAAKRKVKNTTSAAISGVRKIKQQITGTVANLFGSGEQAPSGNSPTPETISKDASVRETELSNERGNLILDNQAQPPANLPENLETTNAPDLNDLEMRAVVTTPKCEKAKATVRKYAFVNVEAKSCEGEIFRFSASRDGKLFAIKVSALSGDLLEVEKLSAGSKDAGVSRPLEQPGSLNPAN